MKSIDMGTLYWLGGSTLYLVTPGKKTILIDPHTMNYAEWLALDGQTGSLNMILVANPQPLILSTALEIARTTKATVVGSRRLVAWMEEKGAYQTGHLSWDGIQRLDDVTITMVRAEETGMSPEGVPLLPGIAESGYILELVNGFTLYVSGGAPLLAQLRTIPYLYQPDLAILPVGPHFTISPGRITNAIRLLRAKHVMPLRVFANGRSETDGDARYKALYNQPGTDVFTPELGKPVTLSVQRG